MRGQANTQTRSNLINRNEGEQDTRLTLGTAFFTFLESRCSLGARRRQQARYL